MSNKPYNQMTQMERIQARIAQNREIDARVANGTAAGMKPETKTTAKNKVEPARSEAGVRREVTAANAPFVMRKVF